MRQYAFILCLLFCMGVTNSQTIDQDKSVVRFSIDNMKWNTVEGKLSGMKGDVVFDKNNLSTSSFNISIDPATVNTESKKRDEHLKNEDFFHVEKYKTINYKSQSIVKSGDKYITKGKMTLHGVIKDVTIPLIINENADSIIIEGKFELNRFDYGLGAEKYKKTFMVGEIVTINISCVLIKHK